MAIVVSPLASFNNGQVIVEIQWNDKTYEITRVLVTNNSLQPVIAFADKPGYPRQSITCAANDTAFKVLGSLSYEVDAVDGSLHLGDIVLGAGWPT